MLLIAACLLFLSSLAHAQSGHGTLWLVDGNHREAAEHEAQLREVLDASRSTHHIVGQAGIEKHIQDHGLDIPGCVDGTAECSSGLAAAVQSLSVSLFVRIEILRSGTVNARAFDDSGKLVRSLEVSSRNTRQAIMRAVAEITGATGRLLVDTTPAGAAVFIDGEEVGKTPLSRAMAVGSYSVDVLLPGYAAVHDTMDVPPEGVARRAFNLERLQATLTVRSGTPNAYIRIDDSTDRLPINEPLLIDPGPHRITVEADGYDRVTERFDFEPGQQRELSATLALSLKELTKRRAAAIQQRPIMLQLGLRYMRYGTDWSGARNRESDDRVLCSARPATGECSRSPVNSFGLDLAALYAWRYLEVEAFGLSFYHLGQNSKAVDFQVASDPSLRLSHVTGSRTLFRVGHVGGRYLVNEYFEPYARLGFSFAADRFRTEDLRGDAGAQRFKRAAVLLELRAGARVHLNQLLYGYADAGLGFELRNSGTKPAFELGVGVGVNLPNPLVSRSANADQRSTRRNAATEALPEEL